MIVSERCKLAIADLQKSIDKLPKSVWLFIADGSINVMRLGENGSPVIDENGAVDQDKLIATVSRRGLIIDGGDW